MKNLLKLFSIKFLLPYGFIAILFSGSISSLHAQHADLLDHTWYFHQANINGDDLEKPYPQFESSLNFADFGLYINHTDCQEVRTYDGNYTGIDQFDLIGWVAFPGWCQTNAEWEFMLKHYAFFEESNVNINNPFIYSITNSGLDFMLVIENGHGDIAIYYNTFLHTDNFNQITASIYPNPTTGTLFISQSNNRQDLRANLFTLSGKRVLQQEINSVEGEMDLKELAPGVYFLVLENEEGVKSTIKILKK